jgi:hypothetical protein
LRPWRYATAPRLRTSLMQRKGRGPSFQRNCHPLTDRPVKAQHLCYSYSGMTFHTKVMYVFGWRELRSTSNGRHCRRLRVGLGLLGLEGVNDVLQILKIVLDLGRGRGETDAGQISRVKEGT